MNLCEGDFDKSCYMYCLDAALIPVISQSIRVISTLIHDIIGYYTCYICADHVISLLIIQVISI